MHTKHERIHRLTLLYQICRVRINEIKAVDGGVLTIHMFVGNFDFLGSFPQMLMGATRAAWNGSPEIDPYWEDSRRFYISDEELLEIKYPYILGTLDVELAIKMLGSEAFAADHPPLN